MFIHGLFLLQNANAAANNAGAAAGAAEVNPEPAVADGVNVDVAADGEEDDGDDEHADNEDNGNAGNNGNIWLRTHWLVFFRWLCWFMWCVLVCIVSVGICVCVHVYVCGLIFQMRTTGIRWSGKGLRKN